MASSWRDMSTPLNPQTPAAAPAPPPDPAPSASASSGGSWKDMSTPLKAPSAPAAAAQAAAPAPTPAAPEQSWSDYLLGHLAGANQTLSDTSRVASDAATFGLVDKLFGKQAQADTAAAYQRLGYGAIPVSMAGGLATGGPELKAASAIGEALGGGRIGAALGSGTVGAGSGALAAYGHEAGWTPDAGDIGKGAALSGALGAGAGALSGPAVEAGQVSGRQFMPRATPPASTSADLASQATAAYKPLDNILYDGKSAVHPELDAAENAIANSTDLTGSKRKLATSTMDIVDNLRAKPQISASDIQQAQGALGKAVTRGNIQDQQLAPQFHDALQNVLEQGVPQTGVPPTAGPGYAAAVKADGDKLFGQSQDMARLENWRARSRVSGGPDVAGQAKSFLTSDEGQRFAPPPAPGAAPSSAPLYSATNTLAATAAAPEAIPWYVKHFMLAPLAGIAGNELYAGVTGQEHASPMEHIAVDLGVGTTLMGAGLGYRGITSALNRAAQQRAVDALGSTISTGKLQTPLAPMTPVRNALRMLLMGQGSAGDY